MVSDMIFKILLYFTKEDFKKLNTGIVFLKTTIKLSPI